MENSKIRYICSETDYENFAEVVRRYEGGMSEPIDIDSDVMKVTLVSKNDDDSKA